MERSVAIIVTKHIDSAAFAPASSEAMSSPRTIVIPDAVVASSATGSAIIRASRVVGAATISKLRLEVTTSTGSLRAGVYAPGAVTGQAAQPGVLKRSSGEVAVPAIGVADIALTAAVAVENGDWFANKNNGSAAYRCLEPRAAAMSGGALAAFGAALATTPLDDPWPGTTEGATRAPVMVGVT